MEPQLHVEDKKQVLNHPPVSSGQIDYLAIRLSVADQDMGRMPSKDR